MNPTRLIAYYVHTYILREEAKGNVRERCSVWGPLTWWYVQTGTAQRGLTELDHEPSLGFGISKFQIRVSLQMWIT